MGRREQAGKLAGDGGCIRTICIIQARLGSSRFPRKVLAPLLGKPVLAHVVERALHIRGVDCWRVAVPVADAVEIHEAMLPYYRLGGYVDDRLRVTTASVPNADDDVLRRFYLIAEPKFDAVMRITGDCPLLDPEVSSRVLELFKAENADFASNDVTVSGFPDGYDTEVFTRALLAKAHRLAKDPQDAEHVTPWMKRQPDVKQIVLREDGRRLVLCRHGRHSDPDNSGQCIACGAILDSDTPKLSIDTPDDLASVEAELIRRQVRAGALA